MDLLVLILAIQCPNLAVKPSHWDTGKPPPAQTLTRGVTKISLAHENTLQVMSVISLCGVISQYFTNLW